PCEVRLYAGKLDSMPVMIPDALAERLKIEEYFLNESEFTGILDSHFQLDRVTYNELRDSEKNTAKSLYQLKTDDAIQNYTVVEEWTDPLSATEDDAKVYKAAAVAAKDGYASDVLQFVPGYAEDPPALLTHYLGVLKKQRHNYNDKDQLSKDIKDKEQAIVMALVKTQSVSIGNSAKAKRMSCLFGDADVYLSGQYDNKKNPEWMKAAAEKTASLALLLPALKSLKQGELNGVSFARKMRLSGLRKGVLALVDYEPNYVHWNDQLKALDSLHAERRGKAGINRRKEIDRIFFDVAREFLATIGVVFENTKGTDGIKRLDPDKPIVPDWDFDDMARTLL
ncbi:MAG: hypothetical protein J0653_00640, partial [Deltaproteobacteria bacterium]|nr:hypothetical protein [Deltaproteobacteria bacterium]